MTDTGFIATGNGVSVYQALAIKHGLRFWLQHGKRINRAYTPKNMVRAANAITGRNVKGHNQAAMTECIKDLTLWIESQSGGIAPLGGSR